MPSCPTLNGYFLTIWRTERFARTENERQIELLTANRRLADKHRQYQAIRVTQRRSEGKLSLQLPHDLVCHRTGFVELPGFEANGADSGVPAAAVSLANGGQIVLQIPINPGIRADRDFRAETGRTYR